MDKIEIFNHKYYIDAGGLFIYNEKDIPIYLNSEKIRNEINDKIEENFLKDIDSKNKNNKVLEIYLKSSNRCNLRCSYCFRKERKIEFNEKTVIEFISNIIDKYDCEKIKVDLTGDSEPLMEIPKLKSIIDICNNIGKEKGVEFVYGLNSNGTVFDEKIKEFLYNNSILFGFTYEGVSLEKNKRIYNNGQAAVDDVEKNIRKYNLNNNKLFGISMTLTSEHNDLVKEYKKLLELCNAVSMRIVNTFDELGVNVNNLKDWKRKYDELAIFLLNSIKEKKYDIVVPILRSRDFFGSFFQTILFNVKKNQPCLAGYRQFFLNYDGCVYLCSWGCDDERYKMGEQSILDFEKVKLYENRTVNDSEGCNKCDFKYICGGECHIIGGKDVNLDAWCDLKRHLIGLAIHIVDWMNKHDEEGKKILMESISSNMYCDSIEDYIKVSMEIFEKFHIGKGANIIKNEIDCVDCGPEFEIFYEYLKENGLKVGRYIKCKDNKNAIFVLHEKISGYNKYKIILKEEITKNNEKNIICVG